MAPRQYHFWTHEEDRLLKELAGKVSAEAIGEQIGRTRHGVHARIKKLELKGHLSGEQHWNAKVSRLQVAMITTLNDAGFSRHEIHTMFNQPLTIARESVGDILAARTWKQA